MQVKLSNKGATLIVGITGELDHHSSDSVRRKVDAEIMKSHVKNVIFDFSNVNFMDSSGLGVIMGRYKNIRKLGGKMAVVNPVSQVKRVFELSGFMKIIEVYENIESAINTFAM